MTKKILIMVSTAMLIALVGCIQEMVEVTTTTKPSTTIAATTTTTTTEVATTTTTHPQTTKDEITSTTTHATTKPTTTKPKPTTEKATTTQKVTTTKAKTEPPYFCDEGGTHHSCKVGPIGWTSSFDEAEQKALRYIDDHADSGSFRVTQCQYCGKYSANITLDKKEEHNMPCGNVGKWYSSKQAFMNEYNSKVDYWNDKLDNDEISHEEYIKQVPRGYEIWQCAECGKWTGNYKYKQ